MKVLVIEDQEKLATLLKRGLEKEGHIVDWLNDGEKGQDRLEMYNKDYDVVILDLMMPKKTVMKFAEISELQISQYLF